jgi:uncharacterized protein (DUF885 family)
MNRSGWVAAVMLSAACRGGVTGPDPARVASDVNAVASNYLRGYLDAFPEQALAMGAQDPHPSQLGDHSLPAIGRWEQRENELLSQLKAIDIAPIADRAEAVTHKFMQQLLEGSVGHRLCRMELWNVSPTWTGWQAAMPVLMGMETTTRPEAQQDAFARWSQLPKWIDDEIVNLKEGLRLGFTAPKGNVQSVINQVEAMLAGPVSDAPAVLMAKGDAESFRKRLATLEQSEIRPAITRYRDFLKSTYLPAAREAIGVSANPNGANCYTTAVKYHATVDMTAQQVHDLGKSEIAKIQAEMRTIGQRSFGVDDPQKLLTLVKTDPKYRFRNRAELIKLAEDAVARSKAAVPNWFGRVPASPVIVEPYPSYVEKTAPGGQYVSPSAGGAPGKYLINAYKANEQSRAGVESTAFHEAYPGHHMQSAIALEQENLHPVQRYFFLSGFGEGWGLYAERLSDEMKLFSSDVDRLGLLSNEALRAARLVVDSGMHALGWSRQQAIDYVLAHTTETVDRATAEIDRYIAVPGQATAYMIGNLEIRRLREDAKTRLGDRFDIKVFHDIVLEDGAVPLWVLKEKIERFVSDELKRK